MIQLLTRLDVADNTGAKTVAMIRRIGQLTDTAGIGDVIVCSIKDSTPDATAKKGTVSRAVIVRTTAPIRRADGSYLRFDSNAVVLLDANGYRYGKHVGASAELYLGQSHAFFFLVIIGRLA